MITADEAAQDSTAPSEISIFFVVSYSQFSKYYLNSKFSLELRQRPSFSSLAEDTGQP